MKPKGMHELSPATERESMAQIGSSVQAHIEEETVGFHMTRTIITIQSHEPIINAYKTLIESHIGCLPVLEGARIVGLVTARTLVKCAARKSNFQTEVRAICTPSPTASPLESIRSAIEKLRRHHARYLIVLDEDDSLVGLVSQTDLLEASRRLLVLSERKLARVERLAYQDTLTGLHTRPVFENAFEDEFKRAQRYGGLLSLLLLDIDHFKHINDHFGHPAGDTALRQIGEIIQRSVRKVDIACRYGGDEFAILMPECGTRAAAILGERIRGDVEREKFSHENRFFCATICGGICKWAPIFKSPEDMLNEADRCMYEAKRKGRNRIIVSS